MKLHCHAKNQEGDCREGCLIISSEVYSLTLPQPGHVTLRFCSDISDRNAEKAWSQCLQSDQPSDRTYLCPRNHPGHIARNSLSIRLFYGVPLAIKFLREDSIARLPASLASSA